MHDTVDPSLRAAIRARHRTDERQMARLLLDENCLSPGQASVARVDAGVLIAAIRARRVHSPVDALMREYDLSSQEGLALMAVAEALLRVPDNATRDMLIRDKLGDADWAAHAGQSPSLLVNLSTFGLELGARMIGHDHALGRLMSRMSAPVLRGAVTRAIYYISERFVFAETIGEGLQRAVSDRKSQPKSRHSFDMLGEAARTDTDAARYYNAYRDAIVAIGRFAVQDGDASANPGISVKLSALHPRYEPLRAAPVKQELLPRVLELAILARDYNIGFTIDAEEAERLELSLDMFEALALDPALAGWMGLGLAIQAYQKRALPVVDWVADLGRRRGTKLMVRLVKGAYWDSEIKRAQIEGLDEYPVFTEKPLTDLSYLAAARRMLAAGDALYPMFATHNAFTVAAIRAMAAPGGATPAASYEFQRLHGMGDALYETLNAKYPDAVPCRVYAPVGPQRDLLAYLVRRLLENGANSSFVSRLADPSVAIGQLIEPPMQAVGNAAFSLKRPCALYGARQAAPGLDFGDPVAVEQLYAALRIPSIDATPLVDDEPVRRPARPLASPADAGRRVGSVVDAQPEDVSRAMKLALAEQPYWAQRHVSDRAACLDRAADLLITERDRFIALLVHEGGRTARNALGEFREAVDFLRYYASQAQHMMVEREMPGPTGERNLLTLAGKGVFACISPWNFPLSIFLGQIAAALVTGNAVLIKPAPETPLIGFEAFQLLCRAGVYQNALFYLPGGPDVGAALVGQPGLAGVVFTGSTATARRIAIDLAQKEGPLATLIAETGGQNAMIVDSSALLEQVVGDVMVSAFDSAGQRCSALRILALQEDIADSAIEMLTGAMATLKLGDPALPETDIGPVIHEAARQKLERHLVDSAGWAKPLFDPSVLEIPATGTFFAPRLLEIDRIDRMQQEVFGPILHVVRWKSGELPQLVAAINNLGYGLTLGLETRIEAQVALVRRLARVGNLYVNRSQVGAVVESQPFGGEGLSGTGPKAGGPHYLMRFVTERVATINLTATGGDVDLLRGGAL